MNTLIKLFYNLADAQMTASIGEYLFKGEAEVTCRFLGTPVGLVVLYPPWAGVTGRDRCASWDGGVGVGLNRCNIQNTCQASGPNHGTYTIPTCIPSSGQHNVITLSVKITNGNDGNVGTWTCATYSDGANTNLATVNLAAFGK